MENDLPPKVLVKTWLELLQVERPEIRKQRIENNINRIFGSTELAHTYIGSDLKNSLKGK